MPQFTQNWTTSHFPKWERLLLPFRERPCEVLEIGSFEGRSALFFLDYLPQARLTCVDLFRAGFEETFNRNLAAHRSRLEKLKGPSATMLGPLVEAGRRYDVIYVDGGHSRDDVLTDSALVWPMLAPDGILIWDDYRWHLSEPAAERPKPAVDAFIRLHRREVAVVMRGYQVAIRRKRAAEMWPEINLHVIGDWLSGKRNLHVDWRGDDVEILTTRKSGQN